SAKHPDSNKNVGYIICSLDKTTNPRKKPSKEKSNPLLLLFKKSKYFAKSAQICQYSATNNFAKTAGQENYNFEPKKPKNDQVLL
ncbi:21214_t:CDS:1, partial [Gigaspora rosea]